VCYTPCSAQYQPALGGFACGRKAAYLPNYCGASQLMRLHMNLAPGYPVRLVPLDYGSASFAAMALYQRQAAAAAYSTQTALFATQCAAMQGVAGSGAAAGLGLARRLCGQSEWATPTTASYSDAAMNAASLGTAGLTAAAQTRAVCEATYCGDGEARQAFCFKLGGESYVETDPTAAALRRLAALCVVGALVVLFAAAALRGSLGFQLDRTGRLIFAWRENLALLRRNAFEHGVGAPTL
jgi:hypothetical protein